MLSISAVTTQKKPNAFKKLLDTVNGMVEKGVVAGFPRGRLNTPHYQSSANSKPGASIIDVAIYNNYGMGVPRRDFMTPASKKWMKFFKEAYTMVQREMIEEKIDIDKFLQDMGRKGQNIIYNEITALDTPPNAPSTIKRKGSSNPLIDTGAMRQAATWQIRGRKSE